MKGLGKDSTTFLEADENSAGQRIDNLLVRVLKGVPRPHIYQLVRTGQVRVNSGRVDPTYRVQIGDRIRIPPVRTAQRPSATPTKQSSRLDAAILFEDDHLLVLNKPAGMAVHGGSGISRGVIEEMRQLRPTFRFLELVHRLDRETSGVLLLAKKRSALTTLHAAIRAGQMHKHYILLVKGRVRAGRHEVSAQLEKYLLPGGDRRVKVTADGQSAKTVLRLLREVDGYSLLDAELLTGRTHQIRVHAAHIGHPIVGDDKYGDFALNKKLARAGLKRMFLHAAQVDVQHPATQHMMRFEAPLGAELDSFLSALQKSDLQTGMH
jgi:23S rRNA pseudouridine955/2504/2580 synthase